MSLGNGDSPYGHIVIRRGLPTSVPFEAGQQVDRYTLEAPLPMSRELSKMRPRQQGDPHELARRVGAIVKAQRKTLRVVDRVLCDCPPTKGRNRSGTLAVVYAFGERPWIHINPEKRPSGFRSSTGTYAPTAWPMHREPNGSPHVEMTTCRCRRTRAIVLTKQDVFRVHISRPAYDLRVEP